MERVIKISEIQAAVNKAYDEVKTLKGGANANYIPYLDKIDSNLFGLAVTLPNGQIISVGDTKFAFGIESISKVHNAIAVMRQSGAEEILAKIGADATGMPFNSIFAILLENEHPSTPLVNAGAICAVSMITPHENSEAKWKFLTDNMADLSGSNLTLLEDLYVSESETNYNNRAIAWLLKNYDRIYDDVDMSLDLYTRGCSMGVTVEQLSITGATIALLGRNPVTGKQVFDPSLSPKITSMIATVGFYEHTGDWLYTTGIPAKTGVGGGIMGILPGGFGIAAFAPPLDQSGNSVKAQAAIKSVANTLNVGVYDGISYRIE